MTGTPCKNVIEILVVARKIVLCVCSKSRMFFLLSLRGECQFCSLLVFFFVPISITVRSRSVQLKMPLFNLMKQNCFNYCNYSINSSVDG